jgi:hypothetical protein
MVQEVMLPILGSRVSNDAFQDNESLLHADGHDIESSPDSAEEMDFWGDAMLEIHNLHRCSHEHDVRSPIRSGSGATHPRPAAQEDNRYTSGAATCHGHAGMETSRLRKLPPHMPADGADRAHDVEVSLQPGSRNQNRLEEDHPAKLRPEAESSSPKSLLEMWPFEDEDSIGTRDDTCQSCTTLHRTAGQRAESHAIQPWRMPPQQPMLASAEAGVDSRERVLTTDETPLPRGSDSSTRRAPRAVSPHLLSPLALTEAFELPADLSEGAIAQVFTLS